MINNLNISNLQVFNKEGATLPCSSDLQEAMQVGIAKKVGKLLNAEGFLALIPNFDPTKDTKLRIHLTKEGITIQLLERAVEDAKADPSYTKKDPELSEEIKTRKEKIITKVNSLFKEPPSFSSSPGLKSDKIHPLFIPSQPSKDEQIPFKIGFDATVSNPQIQQLHAKIEALQDQLNKKTPHSEELQVIKEQLELLSQAICNFKQENIKYPQTEQYDPINTLIRNQQDICLALLALLSRNLNQPPTLPSVFQDTKIKEVPFESKENTSLEELIELKKGFKELSNLQQEKEALKLEHRNLTEQLNQVREIQTQSDKDYTNKIKQLERSNTDLQANILDKDKQIAELDKQVKNSENTHQELERQLSQLQKEKTDLEQTNNLTAQSHEKALQLVEGKTQEMLILQEKLEELSKLSLQLSVLQQEKEALELEHRNLTEQLNQVREIQTQSDKDYTNKINRLESSNIALQTQLSTKDKRTIELEQQIKNSDNTHQELEKQLSLLQQELGALKQSSALIDENHEKTSQLLGNKEEKIAALQEKLEELPLLTLKLFNLQQEKDDLELEYENLTEQLNQSRETHSALSIAYNKKTEQLESSNIALQTQLSTKDKRITELQQQTKSSDNTHQELEKQLSLLQQELEALKQSSALIDENHEKTSQLLEDKQQEIITLQEKLENLSQLPLQLSNAQKEKDNLELELEKQLDQASQSQLASLKSHQNEKASLQVQLSSKDEEISELNKEVQYLFDAYQALQNQLENEKEISSILETAAMPEVSKEIASIDTIIKEAEKAREEALFSLENSTIAEGLLTSTPGYYTLTATPPLEESLETSTEITTLQAKINDLRGELENIRPIAYNTTSRIEEMEKSNKVLALELSEKKEKIENLEEEKKFLEAQLVKSEQRLKKLQIAQHTLKEKEEEISTSSEENNELLEELEKAQERLLSEKRKRAELEQAHENQLEKLKTLYDENALEKMERMNAKIFALQEQQKNVCFTLVQVIADYMKSESITEDIGQNIFKLIEEAFNTTGYKTLLDLVSSEKEDLMSSSEESISSDEYDEDSYIEP